MFELTGVAGGCWKFGLGETAAVVKMDMLEFNIFVSGRSAFDHARSRMILKGDTAFDETLLKGLLILY